MPEISDRFEQFRAGQPRYFTGKPCKRQHLSERFVSNGACIACVTRTSRRISATNVVYSEQPFIFEPGSAPEIMVAALRILSSAEWCNAAYKAANLAALLVWKKEQGIPHDPED